MDKQQDDQDMKIRSVYEQLDRFVKLCHSFAILQQVIKEEIEYELDLSTIKRVTEGATKPSTAHFYLYVLRQGLKDVLANRDELILKGIDLAKGDKIRTSKGKTTYPLKRQSFFLLTQFAWRERKNGDKQPYKDSILVDVIYLDKTCKNNVLTSDVDWELVHKFKPSSVNFQHNIDMIQSA
ncbi:hypothetical protein [Vibrio parahaemolyticus]|uniref:hypothetical protein n=1 Tax=Vibrio parahaemolyticus TaxID=670 RepID=UPI0008138B6A|nr:hypothetical protein [Vibrio parahaemolyticus]OCP68434.1 hypothetical protein AKH08_16625 [Vibrio parahaemolyticus]